MKKDKHLGLTIDPELHFKLHYIAQYEGRSGNRQVIQWIRKGIKEFEAQNGEIKLPENNS